MALVAVVRAVCVRLSPLLVAVRRRSLLWLCLLTLFTRWLLALVALLEPQQWTAAMVAIAFSLLLLLSVVVVVGDPQQEDQTADAAVALVVKQPLLVVLALRTRVVLVALWLVAPRVAVLVAVELLL